MVPPRSDGDKQECPSLPPLQPFFESLLSPFFWFSARRSGHAAALPALTSSPGGGTLQRRHVALDGFGQIRLLEVHGRL